METGRPSRTALGVANRRAIHQVLDQPPILLDPIAIRILGPHFKLDREQQANSFHRSIRLFMAARSRFAEDCLAQAVAAGVAQYVLLGAGLDTFAYRNPFPGLRVFEVDHPATQAWKRSLLLSAQIPEPVSLTFVPLDFERQTLHQGLAQSGYDPTRPAFFGWLGVVPYLTLTAFRATIDFVARLPEGSGIAFDYALDDADLSPRLRLARLAIAARVALVGEPFRLYFRSAQLDNELQSAGFQRIEQLDSLDINLRYCQNRADGLCLPEEGLGKLAAAWV
jgi:methyltransferase (TIGR00027 family)